MKSWWIRTEGNNTIAELREIPAPTPGTGEIVVRVHAASLNRGQFIAGSPSHPKAVRPGGTDAAGIVHAVGKGVTTVKPGDRVMGRTKDRGGGFAEYALLKAHQAIPLPECLSWEQAGAIPAVFLVTYDMLYPYGKLRPGEWLLITAASSGVGVACIQAGKLIGAHVIGTSGSAKKLERLKSIGLDVGIETRRADFAEKVKEASGGRGADLIVNCVGGSVFSECMRALAYKGRLATVGYLDGVMKSEIDLEALHSNRFELFGVSNSRLGPEDRAETVRGFSRDLLPAIDDGRITPVIDKVFPFDELPAAKDYMESNTQVGKIVVSMLKS